MTITEIITLFGGATVVAGIIAVWLGRITADRVLAKYEAQSEKKLEEYKVTLEKTKHINIRFSDAQFQAYVEIWNSLIKLRNSANRLWEEANLENLTEFIRDLGDLEQIFLKSIIFLADKTIESLSGVLNAGSYYRRGKKRLIEIRTSEDVLDAFEIRRRARNPFTNDVSLKDEQIERHVKDLIDSQITKNQVALHAIHESIDFLREEIADTLGGENIGEAGRRVLEKMIRGW